MIQQNVRITSNREIAEGVFLLTFDSEEIARSARPGQFLNIRPADQWSPLLLRRPFSISRVVGKSIELLYNVVGKGTKLLGSLCPEDSLDIVGPLGKSFRFEDEFRTAVIVAGGLGIAPFPFLTDYLEKRNVDILTFIGSRTEFNIKSLHLANVHYATDDGSCGFRGSVVESLASYLAKQPLTGAKIFACGPTKMMAALSVLAEARGINCELSLEGDMACGIGICQGCPVERNNGEKKYALVCTDGPTFNSKDIKLPTS